MRLPERRHKLYVLEAQLARLLAEDADLSVERELQDGLSPNPNPNPNRVERELQDGRRPEGDDFGAPPSVLYALFVSVTTRMMEKRTVTIRQVC